MERAWEGKSFIDLENLSDLLSIIAIMLGRLEMDVGECLETYMRMSEIIFGKKGLQRHLSEGELINNGKERCRV